MLKRLILWDFPRGSWQYDIVVLLILAFMFLPPRDWFRDQPRIPNASGIAMLPSEHGSSVFFVDKELLQGVTEDRLADTLTSVLRARVANNRLQVTRVEPIRTSEGDLQGYMAFANL